MLRWTLLMVVCCAAGCGGAQVAEVAGEVKCDGGPLAAGEIIFESPNQELTPAAGEIKDGKYRVPEVPPGPKIVKISASRGNGVIDPLMKQEGQEPMIPPEFNTETKLKAELKPGKNPGVNFEVTSIPK